MKFEGSWSKGTGVIERKIVFTLRVTVTFVLLMPKSIGVFYLKKDITL